MTLRQVESLLPLLEDLEHRSVLLEPVFGQRCLRSHVDEREVGLNEAVEDRTVFEWELGRPRFYERRLGI